MAHYDVVVVGLGAMGSAALYHLARRGLRVLGIDRFAPGHDLGSSHGETRIIRLSYFEHPSYVPLLRQAYDLWRELERESGQHLLQITGIAEIGREDGTLVRGTLAAARLHGLAHEVVGASAFMRRFPAFQLSADQVAVWQPDGGFLAAEASIRALAELATHAGAEIRTGGDVQAIEQRAGSVHVATDQGAIVAGSAIVAAGPWIKSLMPALPVPLRVTRQVMAWFEPAEAAPFAPGRFPVFLIESRHGMHYGFPPDEHGRIKVAKHHHRDEAVEPDSYDRLASSEDIDLIRAALAEYIPAANGPLAAASTCLYTVTPDGDFVIDRLPQHPQVIIASPCSGHGFKFAPVVGEILADLATRSATVHDIARFRLTRFA
jgi:sarcosine oxidase